MAKRRFEFKKTDGALSGVTIIVDNETGVNYLVVSSGYGAGLTPLLDREGKVVVTSTSYDGYEQWNTPDR